MVRYENWHPVPKRTCLPQLRNCDCNANIQSLEKTLETSTINRTTGLTIARAISMPPDLICFCLQAYIRMETRFPSNAARGELGQTRSCRLLQEQPPAGPTFAIFDHSGQRHGARATVHEHDVAHAFVQKPLKQVFAAVLVNNLR